MKTDLEIREANAALERLYGETFGAPDGALDMAIEELVWEAKREFVRCQLAGLRGPDLARLMKLRETVVQERLKQAAESLADLNVRECLDTKDHDEPSQPKTGKRKNRKGA